MAHRVPYCAMILMSHRAVWRWQRQHISGRAYTLACAPVYFLVWPGCFMGAPAFLGRVDVVGIRLIQINLI